MKRTFAVLAVATLRAARPSPPSIWNAKGGDLAPSELACRCPVHPGIRPAIIALYSRALVQA
jgi:hypothetical protein